MSSTTNKGNTGKGNAPKANTAKANTTNKANTLTKTKNQAQSPEHVVEISSDSSEPVFVEKYTKKNTASQAAKHLASNVSDKDSGNPSKVVHKTKESSTVAAIKEEEVSSDSSVPRMIGKYTKNDSQTTTHVQKRPAPNVSVKDSGSPTKHIRQTKEESPMWDIEHPSRSPSPADAPPVTVTNTIGKCILSSSSKGRSLTFGQIDSDGNDDENVKPIGKAVAREASPIILQRRVPKPSEKVRYMQDANNEESDEQPSAKPSSGSAKTPKDKGKAPIRQAHGDTPFAPSRQQTPQVLHKKTHGYNTIQSEHEKEEEEEEEEETGSQKAACQKAIEKFLDETEDVGMHWAGPPDLYASKTKPTTSKGKDARKKTPQLIEDPVMKYQPCELVPYTHLSNKMALDPESSMPMMELVHEGLVKVPSNLYGARNFLRFYMFIGNGVVLNPARANAEDMTILRDSSGGGRIISSHGPKAPSASSTMFVSTGAVSSCELVNHGVNGSGINVKKIGVWFLYQEFEPMLSLFGHLYERTDFWSNYFNDVVYLGTQKEGANTWQASSANPSPKKPAGMFGPRTPAKTIGGSVQNRHPHYLKFTDKVPIYDIRNINFKITPESMSKLSELPLYQRGLNDLETGAAVTVGYTVNMFSYTGQRDSNQQESQKPAPKGWALSFNIHFVLFHGVPDFCNKD